MRSVGSHSMPEREKEGMKRRMGRKLVNQASEMNDSPAVQGDE